MGGLISRAALPLLQELAAAKSCRGPTSLCGDMARWRIFGPDSGQDHQDLIFQRVEFLKVQDPPED